MQKTYKQPHYLMLCILSSFVYFNVCAQGANFPTIQNLTIKNNIVLSPYLRILSYNVYFDDDSGSTRYPHILKAIRKGNYDVIALQECTKAFFLLLNKDPILSKYYIQQGDSKYGYTNLILTKEAVYFSGNLKLDSDMGRSAPFIVLKQSNTFIVSIHLESGIFEKNVRKAQLTSVIKKAASFTNSIIAGDLNFGDDDDEQDLLTHFKDPGARLKQVTYDVDNNPLAKQNKFLFEKSRRLDRFIIHCTNCKADEFNVKRPPYSDHWAIELLIQF